MRGSNTHRGTAAAARFAGLGVATAVAFAIGGMPAAALAEEDVTPTANDESAVIAPEADVSSDATNRMSADIPGDDSISEVDSSLADKGSASPSLENSDASVGSSIDTSVTINANNGEKPSSLTDEGQKANSKNGASDSDTSDDAGADLVVSKAAQETTDNQGQAKGQDVATTTEEISAKAPDSRSDAETPKSGSLGSTNTLTKEAPSASSVITSVQTVASRTVSSSQAKAAPVTSAAPGKTSKGKPVPVAKASVKANPVRAAGAKSNTSRPNSAKTTGKASGSADLSVSASASTPTYQNVYRIYNPWSGEHLYTSSLDEATHDFQVGWQWEDAIYMERSDGEGSAVYRLYNPYSGAHFYTQDKAEYNSLPRYGWRQEGTAFRASGSGSLFRLYNPWSVIGEHLYTTDRSEADRLRSLGWSYEGTAWAYTPGRASIQGRWVVSSAYGTEERYWVASDTRLAKNRYVEKSEGAGWRAYATDSGAVVRGFYKLDSSKGLIADNNGSLETGEGMVVTGRYTNGTLQRYYLKNGFLQLGAFSVNGKNYFGRYDTGYVVRGDYFDPDAGKMYRGDNDGVLQARNSSIDRYVDWALSIAMDDSHGYSQIHRYGPDYDCSSMVISALNQAGYGTGGATYTGNMYSEMSRYGWYSVAPNPANLQYGDILLNDTHHTAIYLANGWLVQASSDENGSWEGYQSGDQTGREIYYRTYYNYPWTRFLRHV